MERIRLLASTNEVERPALEKWAWQLSKSKRSIIVLSYLRSIECNVRKTAPHL